MRHRFPVLTVKKLLKSVYIYGSYRKNKIGVPFFLDHPVDRHCDYEEPQRVTNNSFGQKWHTWCTTGKTWYQTFDPFNGWVAIRLGFAMHSS